MGDDPGVKEREWWIGSYRLMVRYRPSPLVERWGWGPPIGGISFLLTLVSLRLLLS